MKPKTTDVLAKGGPKVSSVTPTPTVDLTAITATPTPTTSPKIASSPKKVRSKGLLVSQRFRLSKDKADEGGGGGEVGGGGSRGTSATTFSTKSTSSAALESLVAWWKANLGTNWNFLKAVLFISQAIALLLSTYHFLLPAISTDYQKAVLFNDPAKYGEEGLPSDGKWGSIIGHMTVLLLLLVAVISAEMYCTLKDFLIPVEEAARGSGNQQLFLVLFLAAQAVDIAALVYYTHKYSSFVYLLLVNFAITMILAFAFFEAKNEAAAKKKGQMMVKRDGKRGAGSSGISPSSSSQILDDKEADTPVIVGVMSGTEDVSPIFAAQASKAAVGKKQPPKKAAGGNGRKSTSNKKKGLGGAGGGRSSSLVAFNAV